MGTRDAAAGRGWRAKAGATIRDRRGGRARSCTTAGAVTGVVLDDGEEVQRQGRGRATPTRSACASSSEREQFPAGLQRELDGFRRTGTTLR